MAILRSDNSRRWLIIATMCSCLSGCGGGTVDIMGEDTSTFVGSVNIEKKLSDRSTIDVSYLATAGSNSQFIGTGIQFDGNRISEGVIDNEFTLQTLTAHYDYTYLLSKRLRLTAAPALQLSYIELEGRIAGLNPTFNEFRPAYGLKLGSSLHFSDRTSAVAEAAVYDQAGGDVYITSGIWVKHLFNDNFALKLGYSTHHISDRNSFSSDSCTGPEEDIGNCDDSGLSVDAAGVHLGLTLKR